VARRQKSLQAERVLYPAVRSKGEPG
jgi:hypothetical protein